MLRLDGGNVNAPPMYKCTPRFGTSLPLLYGTQNTKRKSIFQYLCLLTSIRVSHVGGVSL